MPWSGPRKIAIGFMTLRHWTMRTLAFTPEAQSTTKASISTANSSTTMPRANSETSVAHHLKSSNATKPSSAQTKRPSLSPLPTSSKTQTILWQSKTVDSKSARAACWQWAPNRRARTCPSHENALSMTSKSSSLRASTRALPKINRGLLVEWRVNKRDQITLRRSRAAESNKI